MNKVDNFSLLRDRSDLHYVWWEHSAFGVGLAERIKKNSIYGQLVVAQQMFCLSGIKISFEI